MTIISEQRFGVLERQIKELQDKDAIRDVLYRYCRAADRCDEPLMLSCYHDDAIDDHGFFSGPAHEFVPYVVCELRKLALSVHTVSNITIELHGPTATVETYYAVIHRIRHWIGFTDFYHHGRYLDNFELKNGEWRIHRRVIVQDGERWFQTADLSPFLRCSDNYPLQGSQESGEDPVYRIADIPALIRQRPPVSDLWGGFRKIGMLPLILIRLLSGLLRRLRN